MANQYRDRPFPADDTYSRDDSLIAPRQQGQSDPLAELARLIGQADPFSEFGRDQKTSSSQAQPARHDARDQYAAEPFVEDEEPPASRPSWVQNLAAGRQATPAYREQATPVYREEEQPYSAEAQPYREQDHYDPRYDRPQDSARPDPHFDHSGYDPLPGQHAAGSDRYDDVLYGQPAHDPAHGYAQDQTYRDDGAYRDGTYDDGYDRSPYDDEQDAPKARRGGTMTVVVVLLLAVVGTGAAFAYRTFVGSPRSGEPPVIRAETGPNKIVPAGSAGEGSGKQIYDRVGEKTAERVVSREEQPIDVNAKTGPRVVFPPLTQNANPPTVNNASVATRPTGAGVGNGTLSGGEEPRKIRTLSIRPDQADPTAASPAPAGRAQAPAARAPQPASTASTGAPQANGSANGPVALTPQQPAADQRSRVAAINPAPASGGGAFVQVSSQKTEADARASFKALQGKYAGILGSRSASIRKAEIAGKGTFYRAMVGPFGTGDEATQFCLNLKSAGGQCVVQR